MYYCGGTTCCDHHILPPVLHEGDHIKKYHIKAEVEFKMCKLFIPEQQYSLNRENSGCADKNEPLVR